MGDAETPARASDAEKRKEEREPGPVGAGWTRTILTVQEIMASGQA
jgi:hypothetical protein